jgi:hypothetical protein
VERCGVGSNGDVDPACAGACPAGSSSSGAQAELELAHCRTEGAGALCAACGTTAADAESPLLNEHCSADAGPDASTCTRCIQDNCCVPHVACGTECKDFVACMGQYEDYQKCKSDYPSGFLPGEQDHACVQIYCVAEGLCVLSGPQPTPLAQCIIQECAVQYAEIVETEDGASYWECIAASFDAPNCLAEYPQVGEPADALNACIQSECDFPLACP